MTVKLSSSDVQQNFGKVMERALMEEDVIVERYGEPRVAILSYRRYQMLVDLEAGESGVYLVPPDDSPEARERGQALADEVRGDLGVELETSLDEVMSLLRGRTWSS